MYIKTIDIQNYHGIEKLHLDFKEGVNLLIGNNGAGKTSLLNALSVILQEPLQRIQELGSNTIRDGDAFQTTSAIGGAVVSTEANYPIRVISTVVWHKKKYKLFRQKKSIVDYSETLEFELAKDFNSSFKDGDMIFPILCFLPAQRGKLKDEKVTNVQLAVGGPQRNQGYKGAFTAAQSLKDIQQWCFQMEFSEYQKKQKNREYSEFQSIVSSFFSSIDKNAKKTKLRFSSEKGTIVFFDGEEEKPLFQLSDGYQAVLCMIIELAYRAVLLNPMTKNLANHIDGVVLIDEIEMHLHPAWQWKILDALRQTFPKVQFIIATHSPIILSSASDAALFLMKSPNEAIEMNNVYGYTIDDVLSLPQGTMSQPARITEYYNQVEDILETGGEKELNNLIETAKKELKDSPAVLKGFLDFVEINRWVKDA